MLFLSLDPLPERYLFEVFVYHESRIVRILMGIIL